MTSLKILLAEDESAVAISIKRQLHNLGHQVVAEATTGREAIELTARERPDVVIMDIKMPDCDGIEAAHHIAQESPTPVVFLSGYFDKELLTGVIASGGLAYLLKPVTSDQLHAAISLACTRFGEMRDLHEQSARIEQALEERKLISRAKGVIMQQRGVSEQDAHRLMQKRASRSNMRLADLARAILTANSIIAPADIENNATISAKRPKERT